MEQLTTATLTQLPQVRALGRHTGRDPLTLFWTASGMHILHRRGGVLFCHAVHSFARETFLYQADISQADISKGILLHSLLF